MHKYKEMQSKNQWVWCGKVGSVPMAPPSSLRQAISLGRYGGSRYIRRRSHGQHSQRCGSSSQPRTDQQEHQLQPAVSNTHVFVPVAIETVGTWHHQGVELVQEIGRRTANITDDARESTFLFQQLSVALQRGNAVSFQNTFTAS